MNVWYYSKERQPIGPVPESELVAMFRNNQLPQTTVVWRDGMTQWMQATLCKEFGLCNSSPPPLAEQSVSSTSKRFPIGKDEWCEPDYRQMLMWAEALHLAPEIVIERLCVEPDTKWNHQVYTQFKNGRIVSLHWNLELLRLTSFEWVEGLAIEAIVFFVPEWYAPLLGNISLSLPLPTLRRLHCEHAILTKLDLSSVPKLEELRC